MRIYTRTGDTGNTGLFGGGRVPKQHIRVDAYGEVDELNAAIGLAVAALDAQAAAATIERLRTVQEDLFAIGAHLATPNAEGKAATHLPPLPLDRIGQMEGWIDESDARLAPLKNFVLPGGTEAASRLHLARAICRRAERRVSALNAIEPLDAAIIRYLNRLSDLLFTLAREANRDANVDDVPWRGRA